MYHSKDTGLTSVLNALVTGLNACYQRVSVPVSLFIQVIVIFMISLGSGVVNPALAETIITNTATASFSINGTANSLSDSIQFAKETEVTPPDELTLSKQANKTTAQIGDMVTYTINVNNPNSHVLNNLRVEDNLPTGLAYQAGTATLNNTTIPDNLISYTANNTLNFSLGIMPAGSHWTIRYRALIKNNTPIGVSINQAFARAGNLTSDTAQASVNINPAPPAQPLQISKKADKRTVKIGDSVRYTLQITNPNNREISNVRVKDTLPNGLRYKNNSAVLSNTGSGSGSGTSINAEQNNSLLFSLGNMPANSQWTLAYTATVSGDIQSTSLINKAQVLADENNANSRLAEATVELINDNILISKSADKTHINYNQQIEYTVSIENPTQRTLSNLVVDDVLPVGFIYKAGSTKRDGQTLGDDNIQVTGRSLQFKLGSLAKGKSIKLQYTVTVTEQAGSGDANNQVQASSDHALSDLAIATVNVRTPSTITFLRIDDAGDAQVIPPTSYNDNQAGGKHWQEIDSITLLNGAVASLPTPQPLVKADRYSIAEPVVIQIKDLDQNTNSNKVETIIITVTVPGSNDKEVLLLTETAPDSGIFRGVIQTTGATSRIQDGKLSIQQGYKIAVSYQDEEDLNDVSATAALVVPKTRLALNKTVDKDSAAIGELVRYTLSFDNTTAFTLSRISMVDKLPVGMRYVKGSARLNGTPLHNGENTQVTDDGRNLRFALQNMPRGASWSLEYVVKITAGISPGKAINQAQMISGQLSSNIARASITIKDDLMRNKNILTGRVYIGCPSSADKHKDRNVLKNARIYLETGRSVLSDDAGFWHMEGVQPGTHVLQLDADSLPNGYAPLLCRNNTRHAGDAQSQFVDLLPGTLWQVDFYVKKIAADEQHAISTKTTSGRIDPVKQFGDDYLKTANADFEILWPPHNFVPDIASTKIIVKSPAKQRIEVLLNGKKVNPLNYDGSDTNKARTVTIRRWVGVDIDTKKRNNTLLVILKNKKGKELARKTHNIHFSGKPASARFLPEQSYLIADGKTIPVIALQVFDEDGFPMRANTHGYFTLEDSNYQVKTLAENKDRLNLNESLGGSYKYLIGKDGIARIKLNPTTQSGELKLHLHFNKSRNVSGSRSTISRGSQDKQNNRIGNEKIISVWLKPHLRKWIMVGVAEGTLGYSMLSGNLQALKEQDKSERFYKRGRIAFFAKGRIKGKYLLTLAYDTHKKKQKVGAQLDGNIDPDAWYTVYADNSNSQYDAPSSHKLYVKIEKDNFYAMFGDYHTGLTVTELARYERVLNGIKTEYQNKRYSANAFISETSNQHIHQEIAADGTSGLYYLKRHIIANSEIIKIETRDRFHSDKIIESRVLTRYQDYDIDYDAGTLFFKFPVTSRDRDFNPNIIIADYDLEEAVLGDSGNTAITAGGRVAAKTKNGKLEVGVSALNQGRNKGRDDRLVGVDATYQITPDTKLHAEIASSSTQSSQFKSRQAYVIELEKQIADMEARLYVKKKDKHFGIDAQTSEDGIRKAGAELRYNVNDKTRINAQVSHQKNLSNNNERLLAQATLEHKLTKQADVSVGARHSKETFGNETISNDTLLAGGRYTTKNGKVTLRGNIEKNINADNDSELSPDRAVVGVDIKLKQGFTVFAEHETTDNSKQTTHNSRVGVTKSLWKGATGKSSYTQERTDQGQRDYATLGLSQKVKITDKIRGDFSIDQTKTIRNSRIRRFNDNEPAIQGNTLQGTQSDDYTAFSVGLGSNQKDWSWTTRFELRAGEINDKINFRAGLIRHLEDGKNLSAKLSISRSENEFAEYANRTRLSLGSAWHPKNKDFVFLNRLDLVDEDNSLTNNSDTNAYPGNHVSGLESHTQKIIHNMHYNRKINDKTQISLHHGIKYVKEDNKGIKHSTTIDTASAEIRRDINSKWDIGIQGGYLHDWNEGNIDYLAGVSVGVTPMENAWLGLGYNFEGFDDRDFDKNNYKRQGPYVNFRYKFNQNSFDGDLPIRRKKKESKANDETLSTNQTSKVNNDDS